MAAQQPAGNPANPGAPQVSSAAPGQAQGQQPSSQGQPAPSTSAAPAGGAAQQSSGAAPPNASSSRPPGQPAASSAAAPSSSASHSTGAAAAQSSASQSAAASSTGSAASTTSPLTGASNPTAFAGSTGSNHKSSFPMWVIGPIVGGVVGIILLVILFFIIRRWHRSRGEKLPPPPPRAVTQTFSPPVYGSHRRTVSSGRQVTRASSYSTLLAQPSAYPSPGSSLQADSPKIVPESIPSASPSVSSNGTGAFTPGVNAAAHHRPTLAALNTNLHRDASTSSSDTTGTTGGGGVSNNQDSESQSQSSDPPHVPSSDQLRPPSPSDSGVGAPQGSSDSRATSPHPSSVGRLPRPMSMSSIHGSSRYGSLGRRSLSGAPHQGRNISLNMPRPLSVHSNSDIAIPISLSRPGSFYGGPQSPILPVPGSPSNRNSVYSSHGPLSPSLAAAGNRNSYYSTRSRPETVYGEYGQVDYIYPTSPRRNVSMPVPPQSQSMHVPRPSDDIV